MPGPLSCPHHTCEKCPHDIPVQSGQSYENLRISLCIHVICHGESIEGRGKLHHEIKQTALTCHLSKSRTAWGAHIEVDSDVNVDNVSLYKSPRVRNAMAHTLIDRSTHALWKIPCTAEFTSIKASYSLYVYGPCHLMQTRRRLQGFSVNQNSLQISSPYVRGDGYAPLSMIILCTALSISSVVTPACNNYAM